MRYDDSGVPTWARWMNLSWPLFRAFQVQVRVSIWTIVVPLIAYTQFSRISGLTGGEVLGLVLSHSIGLYVVIWVHEMGHIVAGRRYNIPTSLITLSPLGGLAHLQSAPPSPKAEILIALAGPATHALWLAALWPIRSLWTPESLVADYTLGNLWYLNTYLALFNLLPFFPMDGGRVLRGLLALKLHPTRASIWAARVGLVGAGLFVIWGFSGTTVLGGILVAIGISNGMACWQELLLARYSSGPYGEPRAPWESDADAWKFGGSKDQNERPSWFAKRRAARAQAASESAAKKRANLQVELDRLLTRVNDVGMNGLSDKERAQLDRVSKALRSQHSRRS